MSRDLVGSRDHLVLDHVIQIGCGVVSEGLVAVMLSLSLSDSLQQGVWFSQVNFDITKAVGNKELKE